VNRGGTAAVNSAMRAASLFDSFMPMMFGCSASVATAATGIVTPVTAVKLYNSTGTADASATAV